MQIPLILLEVDPFCYSAPAEIVLPWGETSTNRVCQNPNREAVFSCMQISLHM